MDNEIERLTKQKDGVYAERNQLVAAISKMFPSHITSHEPQNPREVWDQEWRNVICVHLPTGQATWHVHTSDMPWFAHLNGIELNCPGYTGYTTLEKYKRVQNLPVFWMHSYRIDLSPPLDRELGPE